MKTPPDDLDLQADLFSRYIIGHTPSPAGKARYATIICATAEHWQPGDQRLLTFVVAHPWALRAIDGALALRRPDSEVRRRLYIMLAVLEAMPDYCDAFLPVARSGWYIWAVVGNTLRAGCSALAGIILLGVIK